VGAAHQRGEHERRVRDKVGLATLLAQAEEVRPGLPLHALPPVLGHGAARERDHRRYARILLWRELVAHKPPVWLAPVAVHVRRAVVRLGALKARQPRVLAAHAVHAAELRPGAAGGEALEHGAIEARS
jgi:hypothetical protein